MADDSANLQQYAQIYTLRVEPGIKRDGTTFESSDYSDGLWCRFQRGVPKKIGGYREIFSTFNGVPRGMITNPYNGINYIFAGNQNGIDVFTTGTTLGVGSGPYNAVIENGYSGFAVDSNTANDFVITSSPATDYSDAFPVGAIVIFDQTNPVPFTVTGATYTSPDTTVTVAETITGTVTGVWLYDYSFQADARNLWQFDLQYSPAGGSLQVLAHPGLNLANIDNGTPTQVLIGNVLPDPANTWTFTGLADTTGQNPTYRPIVVDGGVCVLYPYIFVYGNNGFIANNHVDSSLSAYGTQTLTDWNGPTANQVNMASTKIVKGMPTRGGTNAPSGLFWATDSLIRVSFTGQAPLYWRYDIISSQISIMSSSSVVEMDGTFFWMGVDRFYVYNGGVSVLPNDKNVNWLFDNINYEQRQKVWATKVPRYNEIWFFYPRGSATECTDAIIYNVKDKIWYDAGSARGAQRSCGYTTEVFPNPIWATWNYNTTYSNPVAVITAPASLPGPTSSEVYLDGNQTIGFPPGVYLTTSQLPNETIYTITNSEFFIDSAIITTNPNGVTKLTVTPVFDSAPTAGSAVYVIDGGYSLWEHEFGNNITTFSNEQSLESSFTTCDISWVGGNPSGDTATGVNRRMHLRRVEPDFVQNGDMQMTVLGRKFARGTVEESGPYVFDPETGKIDLRVEYREMRLKFVSNDINGNYEMGRLLITAEFGDERP